MIPTPEVMVGRDDPAAGEKRGAASVGHRNRRRRR